MPFPKYMENETAEAFENPQVGDRFTEMYTFWMYVVEITDGKIVTMECNGPATMPDDGKVRVQTLDEYRKRFAYESIPGYWVRLVDRGNNVEGWV